MTWKNACSSEGYSTWKKIVSDVKQNRRESEMEGKEKE